MAKGRSQYWQPRPDRFRDSEPLASWEGGMRSGIVANWSPPLVRMTVYRSGVELGPASRWLKVVVPFWQVRLEEIVVVESVGVGLFVSGVRFWTTNDDWRIFWTYSRDDVLGFLDRQGIPVDLTPRRFRTLDPGGDLEMVRTDLIPTTADS